MNTIIRQLLLIVFLIIPLTVDTIFLRIEKAFAAGNTNSDLINKISNDYTKKFCNSIGFGLSKESAMSFSSAENKKVFEKRKGIENIDKKSLANKIAISVIDGCGYQLGLYDGQDIEDFANYYLSFQQED